MKKRICIFANKRESSCKTEKILRKKLDNSGYEILEDFDNSASLLICIGGDGTLLEAVHKYKFPSIPMIGINTGHLGFFQEIMPDQLDEFIFNISHQRYMLQPLSTVRIKVETPNGCHQHIGLNEVCVKGVNSYSVHLNISIGGNYIERYSGDGLVFSTPAGSTAYNYSLGGSIVDPRLNLLQVTPIAPMNTTAYRSFTSSMLLPSDMTLELIPDFDSDTHLDILRDGYTTQYDDVQRITVGFAEPVINLVRFEGYDFWTKVKRKFL